MTEPLREFIVSYTFGVDSAAQRRAEVATKATEDRITAENAAALAKRIAQENKAQSERIAAAQAAGEDLSQADRRFVAEREKQRLDAAEKAKKDEAEAFKRTAAARKEQFDQATSGFLKVNAVAQSVTSGIGGFLAAVPFGGFLAGVTRTATAMSDLAVQSQRVGSSAAGIQRFMFALRQQGVGEGEASAALEGFAAKMKTNPEGFRQALDRLGVKTKGADGKALGYDEQLENFGGYLASQPYNIAQIQAGSFGISGPNALNALRDQAGLRKGLSAYDAKLNAFGLDPDKIAEDARKVDQAYSNLETNLKLINTRMQAEFFVPVMNGFDGLAKWMEEHPDATKKFEEGLLAFSAVAALRVIPTILRVTASLTGFNAVVGTLAPAALRILGLGSLAGGAAAATIVGGVAASVEQKAPMVDEYGRVVGNWAGDDAHPYHQGEEGDLTAGDKGQPTTNFSTIWSWIKGKVGFGDDKKVAADIATTAEMTKKLAEGAIGVGTGISAGGGGDGGALGAARRTLRYLGMGGGGDQTHIGGGKMGDISHNPNATKENADLIRSAAKEIGTTPEDLATVISYESAGSFSTGKWGGAGGSMLGLIQFNRDNQRRYGIHPGQPFAEQMQAVVKYMKDRGFKPGMGLLDLYSTINAGRPGLYDASDGNGTVRSHVAKMQGAHAALARAFLAVGGGGAPAPATATPASTMTEAEALKAQAWINSLGVDHPLTAGEKEKMHGLQAQIDAYYASKPQGKLDHQGKWAKPTYLDGRAAKPGPEVRGRARTIGDNDDFPTAVAPDKPVKVEVTDSSAAKIGKASLGNLPRSAKPLADLHKSWFDYAEKNGKSLAHPGMTPAEAQRKTSMNTTIRQGDYHSHGDTFHVSARDAKSGLDAADAVSARRQNRDRVRYAQNAVA